MTNAGVYFKVKIQQLGILLDIGYWILDILMSRSDISIGLDIGTSAVKTVAARTDLNTGSLEILGVGFSQNSGMRRGVIIDVEKVTKAIESSLLDLQKNTGIRAKNLFVNLAGCHIGGITSRGTIAVSRADGEITREDIERVIKESQKVSLPQNREIIHIVPKNFIVDGEGGIKDAEGLHGIRLEVESLLILASSPAIKNLIKCFQLLDLQVEDFIVSPIVSGEAVLASQDKELGAAILDIGAATTDLAVFEEGELMHLSVLPIGSSHITNDIAICLRVPIVLAEKIKIDYGLGAVAQVENKKETLDFSKISSEERGIFSRRELAEIIEARLCELFDLVNKELKKIGRQNLLPAGVVLTGGGAKLPGIIEVARRELRLPARLTSFDDSERTLVVEGLTGETETEIMEKYSDPSFSCALGLARWKFRNMDFGKKTIHLPDSLRNVLDKIKNVLKIFLP